MLSIEQVSKRFGTTTAVDDVSLSIPDGQRVGIIGLHLSDRIRVNNWDKSSFIILMVLVMVFVIDQLSRIVRRKFITGQWRERAATAGQAPE